MNAGCRQALWGTVIFVGGTILSSCGSGNVSQGPPPPPPPPAALTIVTSSNLPGTLVNSAYSQTLQAKNGIGALTWSIAPIAATALFVDGLTIDPSTGVLSGTANFQGTAGFVATVTDSASPPRSATHGFTITAAGPMQTLAPQTFNVGQYQDVTPITVSSVGGVFPFTYTLSGGTLPFGMRFLNQTARITGSPTVVGSYPLNITIQDSYTPPEIVTARVTIKVIAPALSIEDSLPRQILLNRPFSGRVIVRGGIPPYTFSKQSGSLPAGFSSIDPHSGQVSGTPTTAGFSFFTVGVTDSSTPPSSSSLNFGITVSTPLGRNDTPATATPIGNETIQATISPYIDPPGNAPLPADNDYYKAISLSGSVVHVETLAQRFYSIAPIDTVIEIVDGNGNQQTTCRQAGNTSTAFSSLCVDDDIPSPPTTDSALDFKVPGPANTATTFYIHVLDWRGDARPDLRYGLEVSGLVAPLSIQQSQVPPAARSIPYSQTLTALNPIGAVTWSVQSGNLPPGLMLSSAGAITGTATADGSYSFTVLATDSGNPPQTATAKYSIQVVEPLKITSAAVWPDACVNQPYTFAIQTSGGAPPFQWSFVSNGLWVGIGLDQSTGVFSGSAGITGTFHGTVGVFDTTQNVASQKVTLTVNQCP
jgi:large repetitive protein